MEEKLNVCHIVNWYPNAQNEKEAIWTKRHIDSLQRHCENDVFHVQVTQGKFKYESKKISDFEQSFILRFPTRIWFLKEILTTILLCYVLLFKLKRSKYDVFNFQITYPLLTYSKLICWLVKKPIVVTEHWSAYHLNFGVKKELKRIKRIFKNKKLKFICVSEALVRDIENFSGCKIDYSLVPNVIDEKFKFLDEVKTVNSFFMLSFWKEPKNPFLIISVFAKLKKENYQFNVTIGGYGPMIPEMEKLILDHDLGDDFKLTGTLDDKDIVHHLNVHSYFIHNSNYEVASVVCSESICCGTPVIASAVGGIVEYIDDDNGFLVENNDFISWYSVIKEVLNSEVNLDSRAISQNAEKRFYPSKVGTSYFNALVTVIDNSNKIIK